MSETSIRRRRRQMSGLSTYMKSEKWRLWR
jgi:hypothetical protein